MYFFSLLKHACALLMTAEGIQEYYHDKQEMMLKFNVFFIVNFFVYFVFAQYISMTFIKEYKYISLKKTFVLKTREDKTGGLMVE